MTEKLFNPRLIATVWAVYAAATSYGYYGHSVTALTPVEAALPAGSPALAWAAASLLLAIGAATSPRGKWAALGRVSRTAGIAICGALLTMWASSYAIDAIYDGSRMWVSAKNYLLLAITAAASATVMGRNRSRGEVAYGNQLGKSH